MGAKTSPAPVGAGSDTPVWEIQKPAYGGLCLLYGKKG
jgi:hypothetical protein